MQKYDFFRILRMVERFFFIFFHTDYTDYTDKSAKRSGFFALKAKRQSRAKQEPQVGPVA